jgi:hypothetical protein
MGNQEDLSKAYQPVSHAEWLSAKEEGRKDAKHAAELVQAALDARDRRRLDVGRGKPEGKIGHGERARGWGGPGAGPGRAAQSSQSAAHASSSLSVYMAKGGETRPVRR